MQNEAESRLKKKNKGYSAKVVHHKTLVIVMMKDEGLKSAELIKALLGGLGNISLSLLNQQAMHG